jgi:hypothetical protein
MGMAWLSGWSYRKSITLSRASGAVTNYQMKLLVGESSGATGEGVDCNSHVATDFDDLRFTSDDGITLLDYWIESLSGSTPNQLATVWIEFGTIGTGATTFYMYYGKSSAAAVSSGANTFIVFDDFERGSNGDAIGGAWTIVQGDADISTDHAFGGSRCGKLIGGTTIPYIRATATASDNIAIRMRVWKENAATIDMLHGNGTYQTQARHDDLEDIYYLNSSVAWADTGDNCVADAWFLFEWRDFVWGTPSLNLLYNDSVIQAITSIRSSASSVNYLDVQEAVATAGLDAYIDDVIVRHYRTTEPAWGSWGSEELHPASHVMLWS